MPAALAHRLSAAAPAGIDSWIAREERAETWSLGVRHGVTQPVSRDEDAGVYVEVRIGEGAGWAATPDASPAGLAAAFAHAQRHAGTCARHPLVPAACLPLPTGKESREHCAVRPFTVDDVPDLLALLHGACTALEAPERVVDGVAGLRAVRREIHLSSSAGADLAQEIHYLVPTLVATAHADGETQSRSLGMHVARQGGLELLEAWDFAAQPVRIAAEAVELLDAEDCPAGPRDLVLDPSQMVLQIHESIGHPLELDRILGDERNYAGTSFVTPEMFGSYRYGSDLLNISFDPTVDGQLATHPWDEEGTAAQKVLLIERGILRRPMGGWTSQHRAGLPGTANARATGWNRPPIDRMGNLNLEPGAGTMEDLIAATERGILMETNRSWSIDDSRNKFQFGCERARLIVDGALGPVVKNPNYRGISATFWRNLVGVAGPGSFAVMGTPNCGKGEPNQLACTGHAAPACRFADVEVFGRA